MSLLLTRCHDPRLAEVRGRILMVLPAASFQMQKLLGLLDIQFSDSVATVRYPVVQVVADVKPFDNHKGFTLEVLRIEKPRTIKEVGL